MPTSTTQPTTYGLDASMSRFSVGQFQKMIEGGILTSDDKVELLENCVVLKMPRNPNHDGTIQTIQDLLYELRPPGWSIRTQSSITLSDSQPEPDLGVVRKAADNYRSRHPGPDDIALLIEVADTSLARDQLDKARIYARAAIPVYWVVNLVDRRVEVFTAPSGPTPAPAYASIQTCSAGESVPLILDGAAVADVPVSDLFT